MRSADGVECGDGAVAAVEMEENCLEKRVQKKKLKIVLTLPCSCAWAAVIDPPAESCGRV